jgi:hypothetical protein
MILIFFGCAGEISDEIPPAMEVLTTIVTTRQIIIQIKINSLPALIINFSSPTHPPPFYYSMNLLGRRKLLLI